MQITDLHLGNEAHTSGTDVWAVWPRLRDAVLEQEPDLVVITGDICIDQGDRQVYEKINESLSEIHIPFRVIPGNHDSPKMMREVFKFPTSIDKNELFWSENLKDKTLIFLDSTSGEISRRQLTWLGNLLSETEDTPLIFMHHPPCLCRVPYMDRHYPLQNIEDVQTVLMASQKHPVIISGHYHVEKTIHLGFSTVHLGPSPFFTIDERVQEFLTRDVPPGYVVLEVGGERVYRSVRYLSSSSNSDIAQ